jgi:hypothetical protein
MSSLTSREALEAGALRGGKTTLTTKKPTETWITNVAASKALSLSS